jgi:hypothetical protein
MKGSPPNGGSVALSGTDAADELREALGTMTRGEVRGKLRNVWFQKLVNAYLERRFRRRAAAPYANAGTEKDRALKVIRNACVTSAATGALSGAVTTAATLIAAESPSFAGALVGVPIAAVGILGEMVARSLINLKMTCDLAAIFGLSFDPEHMAELWTLYALAFKTHDHEDDDDPGKDLVHRIEEAEEHEIGEAISHQVMGESIIKNLVPVLGIGISAVTNYRKTRALGDTVRRYLRYRRALRDALAAAENNCRDHLDLLTEGLWFLFTADGQLVPEEATVLANMLRKLPEEQRTVVEGRFIADETEWLERLRGLPASIHHDFYRALQVAAAVDKSVTLPEQKILRHAGKALGRELDMREIDKMIKEFDEVGVLHAGAT